MKRLVSIIAFALGIQIVALAQPTISFPSITPCPENNNIDFCMDVTVMDFTDILSMEYTIAFDPEVIRFTGVNNFNLNGLTIDNFDTSLAQEGIITLKWRIADCSPDAEGVTLNDETSIYQLCFSAQGAYGAATEVAIVNEPVDVQVTRVNACPNNIGLFTETGLVSTCVRPLTLIASTEEANEGDDVCVNYSVAGFDNMTSMQFSVNWDSDILRFKEVIVLDNLVNLSESGFGTPDEADIPPGSLTTSWAYVDPTDDSGVTLEDSTVIFQVCYEVTGPCESNTAIEFTGMPTPLEATNTVREGFEITILSGDGGVQVGDCDPTGLQLIANCGDPVNLNDEVCVQVTTEGFQNMLALQHLINWNPFILEFERVTNINDDIVGLAENDFQTENVLNGVLGLDWETVANISQSVPDGSVLFEVCFRVVGLGGDSPIRFPSRPARARTTDAFNIGIAPTNCAVVVNQPDGVTMTLDNVEIPKGETACIDFSVNNFEDIVRTQFSLAWDTAHITFQEIRDITLPDATNGNFDLGGINGGALVFEWEPGQARSVPDGQSIFSLCFEATGDPRDCELIEIVDLPRAIEVISASSNGNNIGLTGQGGEVCVLNPKGFTLDIGEGEGFQGDTVCVPFRVADFAGITSAEFDLGWDPSALSFVEVTTAGPLDLTPEANFDVNSTNVGILGFAWSDAAGASLPDTTLLFNVCYELIGPRNECHDIRLNSQQTVTTLDGDGSVQVEAPGAVCIKDQLIIENVEILPVSCPDGSDGEIILTVSGGTGTIFYNWETTPTQFNNRARNLPVGTYSVTIFDSAVPALVQTETFTVPLTDVLPESNAGDDRVATCDPDVFLLEGSGSMGPEYDYSWTTVGGSLPDVRDRPSVVARGAGLYILTVRNSETFCSVTDTVEVFEATAPVADAGPDLSFECGVDSLQLDGSGSSLADTVAYRWTALDGGLLAAGEDTLQSPRITAPGAFILEAYFTTTGCDAMDTVVVEDLRVLPDANAGQDVELTCADDFVLLDGSGSINDVPVTYQWENEQGDVLVTDIRYQAGQAGTYVLRVTANEGGGCNATDTVLVIPSGEFPTVEAGDDLTLNCLLDTLTLSGEVGNAPEFTVQWSAREGGAIVAGTENSLTPQVTAAGLYELAVTNTATQCVASDSVRVIEDRAQPVAEAGEGGELSCSDANFVLDGAGTSEGPEFAYTWTLNGQVVALDTLQVAATAPGTYLLEVANTLNGCKAVDSVQVALDSSIPGIELDTTASINCQEEVITLVATVTPPTGNYTIEWTTADGQILTDPTALFVDVDRPGTYTLTITNNDNGCSSTAQTVVTSDVDTPVADAGPDRTLTCIDSSVVLDGSASSTGPEFAYQWIIVDGVSSPDPIDSLMTRAELPGAYVLFVTNMTNNCSASDTVLVGEDREPPLISIADPDLLSCTAESVTLDATASEFGLSYSAEWSGVNGEPVEVTENPLVANVSQAGFYQLLLRNETTGCEATATVEVQADDSLPMADAGGDQLLPCPGQPLTLDGSNSSSGADITYLWTIVEGSGSIENATSPIATITQPGTYQLEVRNNTNGCSAANTAIVSLDPALAPANAGEDMSACEDTGMLFAELPPGATGQWTTTSAAKIEAVNEASTFVEGLAEGDNVFTWTVSVAACPDYSSDDVIIRREIPPVANNDLANVPSDATRIDINLVANDQVNSDAWEVRITQQPNLGRIESVNGGSAVYAPNPGIFGVDQFAYELCNLNCPTLCDEASVQVTIDFSEIDSEDFANAITPNGDGVNDEFVFDILENAFDFWPDNELIVFNRWGDIVYRAKPYTNNWRGTTDTGQDLPDGTYYYILRLDIPNGIIYKGDITILK